MTISNNPAPGGITVKYDPDHAPNAVQWLALSEQARIKLAEEHHRAAGIKVPNLKAHAVFHAIVENQLAESLQSVVRAMARLSAEGLPRHEALHAIASVLAKHIQDLFNVKADADNSPAIYDAAVERLTAKDWLAGVSGVTLR
jgi:hypothetical protein